MIPPEQRVPPPVRPPPPYPDEPFDGQEFEVDVDLPEPETEPTSHRSSIPAGVAKHFIAEELRAAEDWENQHSELLPKNFDQNKFDGNYESRSQNLASPRKAKLNLLQTLLGDGEREAALAAYLDWAQASCSEEVLGPLAKKYDLSNIRWSFACVHVCLMLAEKVISGFDRLEFMSDAKKHFTGLEKDAVWSFIQRGGDDPDDITTTADWSGLPSPQSGKPLKKKPPKRDPSGYGSFKARSVMSQEFALLSGPATVERSAFGSSRLPDTPNSAVVPYEIIWTAKREERKVLENGLVAYLDSLPPGTVGQKQKELVSIVDLTQRGWPLGKIASHINKSVKTVQNRISDLKKWADALN
jgi:hypothetical protein